MPRRPNNNNEINRQLIVLNVAEKPSVARALAEVFSQCSGSVEKPMRRTAAQIFTAENVQFPSVFTQGNCNRNARANESTAPHIMITTSIRGHLSSTEFGAAYGWKSVPPSALFDAPIETGYKPDMEPLEQMLRTESRNVDALILWLDCDREGEAIAHEVREVCIRGNPRLNNGLSDPRANPNNHIYRAKFSTVLPGEIKQALRSLGRVNENFVDAVHARSELDFRVGAAFTRFQTLRLQKKFQGLRTGSNDSSSSVVSYGPCQFPTLGFVVERWARIETFVPEDFWFLEMKLELNEGRGGHMNGDGNVNEQSRSRTVHMTWKRVRLYDRLMTMVLYESCLDAGEAVVTSLSGRPKNKWRPIPLATVELQKRASKYLRIGSEQLMKAAEELYNSGLISYPRTETEIFRPEFEHLQLIQSFQGVNGQFGEYATKLLTNNNFLNPRKGQNDDSAHPPITPCKAVDPQSIQDHVQRGVYTLVVKHYLACCSRDAIGKETEIITKISSEEFLAKGLMILEKNWLEIYEPWERWSTGQGELPRVQVGSRIVPTSFLMKDGRTTPPLPISEVELISLMDRNGIGTDATIAQHIATIQQRQYATRDNQQKFHPTKLGIALVEGYNSMGYQLNKPDLRRETEAECNLVASGRKSKDQIIGPILSKMRDCFDRVNAEAHKLDLAVARHFQALGSDGGNFTVLRQSFSKCGQCENLMTLKEMQDDNVQNRVRVKRKVLFCSTCAEGYPVPRGDLAPYFNGQDREPFSCPICKFQVLKISRGEGYDGNGYTVCPKCFSDAPRDHSPRSTDNVDFRCFSCLHQTCGLAGGTRGGHIDIYPCPFCDSEGSNVTLRKSSRGYMLTCSSSGGAERCQYVVWLPKAAREVTVCEEDENDPVNTSSNARCPNCSSTNDDRRTNNKIVRKLKFCWKPGSVPPHLGREYIGCVLCDDMLRRDTFISLPQRNQVRIRPNRNNVHGRGHNGGRGRNSGRVRNSGRGRNGGRISSR